MQSQVCFKGYLYSASETYAVFSDPQGGSDFVLGHDDCQERLGNLRDNNLPTEETEKALKGWPPSAD